MKLTKSKLKKIIKEELLKEYFDPHRLCRSFFDLTGGECGYSESWDGYGWKNDSNQDKAIAEMKKEMLKITDPYHKAQADMKKKASGFYHLNKKVFNKWRKKDGSEPGD